MARKNQHSQHRGQSSHLWFTRMGNQVRSRGPPSGGCKAFLVRTKDSVTLDVLLVSDNPVTWSECQGRWWREKLECQQTRKDWHTEVSGKQISVWILHESNMAALSGPKYASSQSSLACVGTGTSLLQSKDRPVQGTGKNEAFSGSRDPKNGLQNHCVLARLEFGLNWVLP